VITFVDFTPAAWLIDQAREQSRRFLSGCPCHTCDHDSSRGNTAVAFEEVVSLPTDLSVA
jgi:hypothetical protein